MLQSNVALDFSTTKEVGHVKGKSDSQPVGRTDIDRAIWRNKLTGGEAEFVELMDSKVKMEWFRVSYKRPYFLQTKIK